MASTTIDASDRSHASNPAGGSVQRFFSETTEINLLHLEFIAMHHITINIKDDRLAKQVVWWLEHFKDDGLEIVSVEDLEDLKALQATRQEASVSFEDYLTHAD